MKCTVLYISHVSALKELVSKKSGQKFARHELTLNIMDPDNREMASFRMLTEKEAVLPGGLVIGQPIQILLKPRRGQYEDSVVLVGISAMEGPKRA